MLNLAVIIFAVAALGGLILALHVLRGKFAPWPLSILHAVLGATGLVLLLLVVREGAAGTSVTWALGILALAAIGGFYLASLHRRQVLPPKGVVLVHASAAVIGFALLLTVLLG